MTETEPTHQLERVVFDANLFVQTLISGRGPSFACIELVRAGGVELMVTDAIL